MLYRCKPWTIWCILAACAAWMLPATALAQGQPVYPSQPITVIVPFTPGSGPDMVARAVGPGMASRLGQAVVVDNRPGASGTIGTAAAVRAAPDGHTLLMSADTVTMTPSLYRKLAFSPVKDLAAIGRAAYGTLALVVHPALPAATVADLIALARKQPGGLAYASPGSGTPQHITMELFKQSSGMSLLHVPYKGMSGALTDLIGGQVQLAFVSLHVAMPHVTAGKLRLLAVADAKRSPMAPAVPAFGEAGFPELSNPSWVGLFAPAGTPAAIVERLHAALAEVLAQKDVQDALQKQGLALSVSSPAELSAAVQQDVLRWGRVVQKAGISVD